MLLGVTQGAVGLVGAAAQRDGAQGVGGGGTLHALHGSRCRVSGEKTHRHMGGKGGGGGG